MQFQDSPNKNFPGEHAPRPPYKCYHKPAKINLRSTPALSHYPLLNVDGETFSLMENIQP